MFNYFFFKKIKHYFTLVEVKLIIFFGCLSGLFVICKFCNTDTFKTLIISIANLINYLDVNYSSFNTIIFFFKMNLTVMNIFLVKVLNFYYLYIEHFFFKEEVPLTEYPIDYENISIFNSPIESLYQNEYYDNTTTFYTDETSLYYNLEKNFLFKNNTHFPFYGNKPVSLLGVWQYWWWLYFSFLIIFVNFFFYKLFINDSVYLKLNSYSNLKSNGKWGDALAVLFPVFWCTNIVVNSNLILKILEHQTEANYLTFRIRGKQWYWIYKFSATYDQAIKAVPFLLGRNRKLFNQPKGTLNFNKDITFLFKNKFHKKMKILSKFNFKKKRILFEKRINFLKQTNNTILLKENQEELLLSKNVNFLEQFNKTNKISILFSVKKNLKYSHLEYLNLQKQKLTLLKTPAHSFSTNRLFFLKEIYKKKYRAYDRTFLDLTQQRKLEWTLNNLKKFKKVYMYKQSYTSLDLKKPDNLKFKKVKFFYDLFDHSKSYINYNITNQLPFNLKTQLTKKVQTPHLETRLFYLEYKYNISKKKKYNLHRNNIILPYLNYFSNKQHFFKKKIKLIPTTKLDNANYINKLRMLSTNTTLILPINMNLTVITNSFDVVHSWFVPGLGIKFDAVPGRSTHYTLKIQKSGLYIGHCAEICGRFHHNMPIRVIALPMMQFLYLTKKYYPKTKKQFNLK